MIKHTILVFTLFIVLSISSFADELMDYMKQKSDSVEAVIANDPSLTEEQKTKMRMSVFFGNNNKPNQASDSSNKQDSNKTNVIIEELDANHNQIMIDFNNLTIDSGFIDAVMNSITTPDGEFGSLQSKINVIDTVIKKFSCSGGAAIRDGKTQQSDSTFIYIYWAFGLPRKGMYISCKGGARVDVGYFDRTIIPLDNEQDFVIPKVSDSTIKYAYNKKTTLLMMDVLTGKNVFEKTIAPVKISQKIDNFNGTTNITSVPSVLRINSKQGYIYDDVITTNIRSVPSGLYFVTILDDVGDVVFIKTYNKEK